MLLRAMQCYSYRCEAVGALLLVSWWCEDDDHDDDDDDDDDGCDDDDDDDDDDGGDKMYVGSGSSEGSFAGASGTR